MSRPAPPASAPEVLGPLSRLLRPAGLTPADEEARPVTAKKGFALSLQVGALEAIFTVMQLVFGSVVLAEFIRGGLGWAFKAADVSPTATTIILRQIGTWGLVAWILGRLGQSTLHVDRLTFATRVKATGSAVLRAEASKGGQPPAGGSANQLWRVSSSVAVLAVVVQLAGALAAAGMQWARNEWIYTLDGLREPLAAVVAANATTTATATTAAAIPAAAAGATAVEITSFAGVLSTISLSTISPYLAVENFLLAPLAEELIYRAAIGAVLYRRLGGYHPAYKTTVAVVSGMVFGGIHIVNFFSDRFSQVYVALQMVLGALAGVLYMLVFMREGLRATVAMHIANNITGSLLPSRLSLDLSSPLVQFMAAFSIFSTLSLIYVAWSRLVDAGPAPFELVDGTDAERALERGGSAPRAITAPAASAAPAGGAVVASDAGEVRRKSRRSADPR